MTAGRVRAALAVMVVLVGACTAGPDGATSPTPAVGTPTESPSPTGADGTAPAGPSPTRGRTAPGSPTTTSPTAASPAPTGPATGQPPVESVRLTLEPVGGSFDAPLYVTAPPRQAGTIYVVEQVGRVQVVRGGEQTTFLDITDRVAAGGERGLLGMAFHPRYPADARVFVHYSDSGGDTVLAEVTVPGGGLQADVASLTPILTHPQPAGNHNGGMVAFGPDGMLYLGLGDGGGAGDTFGHGQRPDTLLGTILRLDVAQRGRYRVPADNPFAGGGGAPEVWAYGLRNPWRFAFHDGALYVADVGQNAWEEISVVAADRGGLNFGWPVLEGSRCFRSAGCDPSGMVLPVLEYPLDGACAVVGGFVYDGQAIPGLRGQYLYGDLCAGFVRSFRLAGGQAVDERDWTGQLGAQPRLTSFGRDAAGELYLTRQSGEVARIVPAS